jgi:hypothetical protein
VVRRLLNQFFFERVEVFDDQPPKITFRPEVDVLLSAATQLEAAEGAPDEDEALAQLRRHLRFCRTTNPDPVFQGRGLKETLLAECLAGLSNPEFQADVARLYEQALAAQ